MKFRLFHAQIPLIKRIGYLLGPGLAMVIILCTNLDPDNPLVSYTAGIAVWMAVWWITEAVPLSVTALLPVALFPLFGIMDGKLVSSLYFNQVIFLFLGGFMVALAMEKWNLHKRIAMFALLIFGVKPGRILFGFMSVSAFLSMWISNTATTMMMIPIALAVILSLESSMGPEKVKRYSIGLLLGIAYSSSIGGIATLIGSPPNAAFVHIFAISFPDAPEISFAQWFFFALPVSIVFLLIAWFILYLIFGRLHFQLDKDLFRNSYHSLGKMGREETIVLVVFISLAILWLTRVSIHIGSFTIPGWSELFPKPEYINDGIVAIFVASFLFVLPARNGERIMDWNTANKLPWGIVILFGGGFALAGGFKDSGLSAWVGQQLYGLKDLPPVLTIASVSTIVTFLTELTSNTATSQMVLPILAALGTAIGKNPLLLMVPATLASSFAFLMPVATPPNAIIFGTGRIRVIDLVKVGIIFEFIGILIITLGIIILGPILGIDMNQMPDWAH
ncbi:MAG: SLC13/DASS family transporter [Bacteroidales bacterium]|nr:SLC13/DASS family transporter [Bacteroidales bacterium]